MLFLKTILKILFLILSCHVKQKHYYSANNQQHSPNLNEEYNNLLKNPPTLNDGIANAREDIGFAGCYVFKVWPHRFYNNGLLVNGEVYGAVAYLILKGHGLHANLVGLHLPI